MSANVIDTMDYMCDWMDRVFEAELETMFDDELFTDEDRVRQKAFEEAFFAEDWNEE